MGQVRDITRLHPILHGYAKQAIAKFPNILIYETERTVAYQDELFARGRTTPGSIVTNARGVDFQSMHQWCLALDFCKNVRGQEWSDTAFFRNVANFFKSLDNNIAWGGDFTNIIDLPHIELRTFGTASQLRSKFMTPDSFKKTWSPSTNLTPNPPSTTIELPAKGSTATTRPVLRRGASGTHVVVLQRALMTAGFPLPRWGADGSFGDETLTAVRDFQRQHAHPVDGIVGPITWRALGRFIL